MFKNIIKSIIPIFAFVINIPTLIGGLLIRKKWTVALFGSVVFIVLAAVDRLIEWYAYKLLKLDTAVLEIYPWVLYAHSLYIISVVVLALYFTLRTLTTKSSKNVSKLRAVSITVLSIGAVFVTYSTFSQSSRYVIRDIEAGGHAFIHINGQDEYDAIQFHKNIAFPDPNLWGDPSFVVTPGENEFKGIVDFNGKPVDVTIQLFLNEAWRTKRLRTDANGVFTFYLPPGEWEVNYLNIDLWFDRPMSDEKYSPVLRYPALEYSDSFFDHANYKQRIQLNNLENKHEYAIEIEIVEYISMNWPKNNTKEQVGNYQSDAISWAQVKDAATYEVAISKYTGPLSGKNHYKARTNQNMLLLKDISTVPSNSVSEYYTEISAFDEEGRFLSASKSGFSNMRFSIDGYEIVGISASSKIE